MTEKLKNRIPDLLYKTELHNVKTERILVLILALTASAAFIYLFRTTFIWLYMRWTEPDSYYSHGFMIIPVCIWLFWRNQKGESHIYKGKIELAPVIGIFLSLLLYLCGEYFRIYLVCGVSIVLFITFCGYLILGKTEIKKQIFPFFYLFMMIPLPSVILEKITAPMKIVVIKLSTPILDLVNVPYLLNGFKIELANGILYVDSPCSGLRSFIAFVCLGLLLAYILKLRTWQAATVLISTLPIAILCNVFRVQALLLAAHWIGINSAQPGGKIHDWGGFLMFAIGLFLLFKISKGVSKVH